MKVRSFIRVHSELQPVDVELSLAPGLPQILFLGLPDQALKESALRIRSAIRAQGFQLPVSQQILVHLKPTHLKKSSRGLDLAVAAALLWETGQIPLPESEAPAPFLYGELTLKGEVTRPDDIEEIDVVEPVWTGHGQPLSFPCKEVQSLRSLPHPTWTEPLPDAFTVVRPRPRVRDFPCAPAELACVIAAGEHSTLMVGAPGRGKSTLMEAIPCWLESPSADDLRALRKLGSRLLSWRPVCRPHHSITPLAMIGGGSAIWAGEVARAHSGVLIMDELLEFPPEIQEALREPMDTGSISIVRSGRSRTFPARLLVLATANLCHCGKFVPGEQNLSYCTCPSSVRRRGLARLSGAFADRFAILAFAGAREESHRSVAIEAIEARTARAIAFRREVRGQPVANAWTEAEPLESSLGYLQKRFLSEAALQRSYRRKSAALRVARTLADLAESRSIKNEHLERALDLCVRPHIALEISND